MNKIQEKLQRKAAAKSEAAKSTEENPEVAGDTPVEDGANKGTLPEVPEKPTGG